MPIKCDRINTDLLKYFLWCAVITNHVAEKVDEEFLLKSLNSILINSIRILNFYAYVYFDGISSMFCEWMKNNNFNGYYKNNVSFIGYLKIFILLLTVTVFKAVQFHMINNNYTKILYFIPVFSCYYFISSWNKLFSNIISTTQNL